MWPLLEIYKKIFKNFHELILDLDGLSNKFFKENERPDCLVFFLFFSFSESES